jgi:hypothetical protein
MPFKMSSNPIIDFWYRLVDRQGNPYRQTRGFFVSVPSSATVEELPEAVIDMSLTFHLNVKNLAVYKNIAEFKRDAAPLEEDNIIIAVSD